MNVDFGSVIDNEFDCKMFLSMFDRNTLAKIASSLADYGEFHSQVNPMFWISISAVEAVVVSGQAAMELQVCNIDLPVDTIHDLCYELIDLIVAKGIEP